MANTHGGRHQPGTGAIVRRAWKQHTAIPAFNIPYLPMMEPVVRALRDCDSFGLIMVARLELCKFEAGSLAAIRAEYARRGVPILIQAYPDDLNRMAPDVRRDAFCGKFSVMDVFCQHQLPFTILPPHTVHPSSPAFAEHLDYFGRLCRVVAGMRGMVVGAIGARTTPFKTVRIDELALERAGITMETVDMSSVFARMARLDPTGAAMRKKLATLGRYADWGQSPDKARENLARLGVVLDQLVVEMGLDALAVRCWIELQQQLGISPCVLLSEMNNRGVTAACEVDVGNAVAMHALRLVSGNVATCLDWNNNYGEDPNKCILFHCGPVP